MGYLDRHGWIVYTGGTGGQEASMPLKQVRRGLYERTDTPRHVKITPEFADAVRQNSRSTLLKEIVDAAVRECGSGRPETLGDKDNDRV